jgi:hypothetical protein
MITLNGMEDGAQDWTTAAVPKVVWDVFLLHIRKSAKMYTSH